MLSTYTEILLATANTSVNLITQFLVVVNNYYCEFTQTPRPVDASYGGHAMCLVGYDLYKSYFLAKNSFGSEWGDNGYCWIPFKYFETYSYDRWVFKINPSLLLS